ncbi:Hypothetical predicted protein [Octopus vulgaris]|uniref:Uncharacterized protein n=1 Tax=Octopus vulgaris TaxID=6645 RepID=A0AA36FAM2_OCTVU|nr:Hypothetical predicted protein [Octopus vulgaris]
MWYLKATLCILIGAIGMVSKGANKYVDQILGSELQKIILVGTSHISCNSFSMYLQSYSFSVNYFIKKFFLYTHRHHLFQLHGNSSICIFSCKNLSLDISD